MKGTGIGEFIVEDRVYKYTKLAPIDALRFGTEVLKALGPGLIQLATKYQLKDKTTVGEALDIISPALETLEPDRLQPLLTTAFAHVYTSSNECLGDEASFNSWFQQYPSDLFRVGVTALYYLAKDFFPKLSGITAPTSFQK